MNQDLDGDPGTALAPYGGSDVSLYKMVDEFDAQLIVAGVAPERVEDWCYAFKQGSEVIVGLSIAGVPAAVREMAKHGEVIRTDDPVIVYEDENEVRLVCKARRVLMTPEGKSFELDSTSRALRQLKKQKVNEWGDDPSGRTGDDGRPRRVIIGYRYEEDDKWFEKAHSKAVRNATLPLIRDDCRSAIIEAFKGTPKYAEILEGNGRPNRRPAGATSTSTRPSSGRQQQPAARRQQGSAADAMTVFWSACRQAKLDADKVMAECQRLFDNREPKDLNAQERTTLLEKLTKPPADKTSTEERHVHDPAYDAEGHYFCRDCDEPLEEPSDEESAVPTAQGSLV